MAWRGSLWLAAASLWAAPTLSPRAWADDQGDQHLATTRAAYPAEKSVYNEMRVLKDMQIGEIAPPPSAASAPRLHVVHTAGDPGNVLRVDGRAGEPPALLIDGAGRVGIHTDVPAADARLDVHGTTAILGGDLHLGVHKTGTTVTQDPSGDSSDHFTCEGCINAADVDSAKVQLRVQDDATHCRPGYAIKEIHQDGSLVCIQIQKRRPRVQ